MKFKLIIAPLLFIALFSCKGQYKQLNKNQELNADGSDNSVKIGTQINELDIDIWSVFQDDKQIYWFGSNGNGVYKFDGEKLIQFTKKDGLIDNTIRGIQSDHLGNIFIQTPTGISKFDGSKFTTLKLISSPSNEWKLEPTDLWFHCSGQANDVYRYDGKSLYELKLPRKDLEKAFEKEVVGLSFKGSNNSPYSVFGINKDADGNIWIGTVIVGAFRYDGKSFLWFPEKELSELPDGRVPGVRSMIQDKNGFYWLSNFKSKYKISENDSIPTYEKLEGISKTHPFFKDRIPYFNSGVVAKNGDLWMTTYGGGAWKYDGEALINFPVKDGETDVLSLTIYEDNQGVIWIGTQTTGVFRFDGTSFVKYKPLIKNN